MLSVCTKGLRVTQFQFSVCMYGTCGRIDNKADFDFWLWQMNHFCADSDSKWTTSVQTRAPNESLLRRLGLQMNHFCADLGSKWITSAETRAPNESLLSRLGLQMNHFCTDLHSKWITAAQTRAPNEVIGTRWQQPYWDILASLFYSERKTHHTFFTVYGATIVNRVRL